MEKRKLILASASPRRREILSNMGLNFQVHPACGEEKLETSDPVEAVKALALQKAREVADKTGEPALVIGSDTVVASGNKILGKPHDKEEAFRMLKELQGASHMVYTGVAVIDTVTGEPLAHFAEGTKVSMYPMTDAWIQDYIETGEPMDKAGSYAVQGFFARYIEGLKGSYANVMGLPVHLVYQKLKELGAV